MTRTAYITSEEKVMIETEDARAEVPVLLKIINELKWEKMQLAEELKLEKTRLAVATMDGIV